MTFKVRCTKRWNDEDVIEDYPELHYFDFKLEDGSNSRLTPTIQLHSLEELMKFMQTINKELVIDKEGWIEIYDTFRE